MQVLIPDELQAEVYEKQIKPYLRAGQYLVFSHGFNIHYKLIVPPADINVFMVAPKGPGHLVRSEYSNGKGVPALICNLSGSFRRFQTGCFSLCCIDWCR